MARKKETGELEIRLSTEQAQQRIKELTSNVKAFEKQLDAAGKGNSADRRKIVQDLQAAEAEILKIRESLKTDTRLVINGEVAGKSIKEVSSAIKTLQRELNVIGDDTDPEFIKKARQVAVLQNRLDQLRTPVKEFRNELKNVGDDDSLAGLKAKADKLKQELETLAPATTKFTATATELGQVERRMEFITQQTKIAKGEIEKLGEPGSLARLRHDAEELRAQLEKLPPASRDFAATYIQLDKVEKEIEAIKQETIGLEKEFIEIGNVGSFSHLSAKAKALRADLDLLAPSTKEFLERTRELQSVERRMSSLNRTIEGNTGLWRGLSAQVKQFGVLAAGYLGFQAITSQVQNIIRRNAELSDSLADVRQTTGLAENEVQKLKSALSKIDTRTATKDLLDIVKVAGQFGIPKDQILSFTDAINKSAVVLKSEFKGGAEEITTTLAKLRNILTDIKTDNIADDLLKIGNAQIVLAQEGAATAPVISDFTNRIGGMAGPLGLATDKILGISATLEETGVTAERGGTAVGRIFQKMISNSQEFAKVAGVPLKEYQKLIDTDIYGAFLKFVEGSTRSGTSATAFNKILTDTELSGNGAREVIAKLAGNLPLLTSRVTIAGDALKSTAAITEQYNIKNNNFAANLERLGKNLYSLIANSSVAKFFDGVVTGLNDIIDRTPKLQKLIDNFKDLRDKTKEYENTLPPLLAHYSALSSKTKLNQDQQKELKDIIEKIAKVVPSAVTQFDSYGNALGINTEKVKEFIAAQQKLTAFKNKEAIEQATTQLKSYESSISAITARLNRLVKDPYEEITNVAGTFAGVRKVTDKELGGLRDSLKELNDQAETLRLQIRELKGQPLVDETNKKETTTIIETKETEATTTLDNEALKKLAEFKQKVEQLNIQIANQHLEQLKSQEEHELNALRHKFEEEKLATGDNLEQLVQLEQKYQQDRANIKAAFENKYDLNALQNKYRAERAEVKKAQDDILNDEKISDEDKAIYKSRANQLLLDIDRKYQIDRKNLLQKFTDDRREVEFQQDTQNLLDWHALSRREITKAYNDRKITKQQYDLEIERLEKRTSEIKLQIAKDYGKNILEVEQQIAQGTANELTKDLKTQQQIWDLRFRLVKEGSLEQLDLQKEMLSQQRDEDLRTAGENAELKEAIWKDYYEQLDTLEAAWVAKGAATIQDYYTHVSNALGAVFAYQKTLEDNDLARDKYIHDEKKKNLDKRLADGKISKQQYTDELYKLDTAYDSKTRALKKKQFKREQSQAYAEAVINGLVSVTKTFASYKYPVNVILAALDAIAVGATIAKIHATEPPEFAKGRPAQVSQQKGGIPEGPSHTQGGIDLVDTSTGEIIGNMEGREPIYSTNTYRKNKRVMDILMDASLYHDGKTQVPISVGDPGDPIQPSDGSRGIANETIFAKGKPSVDEDITASIDPSDGSRGIANATLFAKGKAPDVRRQNSTIDPANGSRGIANVPVYGTGKPAPDYEREITDRFNTPTISVPQFLQQNVFYVIDVQRISENIDVRRFGYASATGQAPTYPVSTSEDKLTGVSVSDLKDMIESNTEAFNRQSQAIARLEERLKIPIKAEMPYYEYKQRLDDIGRSKSNAQIGG